jgi:hypothetical protein
MFAYPASIDLPQPITNFPALDPRPVHNFQQDDTKYTQHNREPHICSSKGGVAKGIPLCIQLDDVLADLFLIARLPAIQSEQICIGLAADHARFLRFALCLSQEEPWIAVR